MGRTYSGYGEEIIEKPKFDWMSVKCKKCRHQIIMMKGGEQQPCGTCWHNSLLKDGWER